MIGQIIAGVAGGIIIAYLAITFWVYILWAIAGLCAISLAVAILRGMVIFLKSYYGKDERDNRIAGASILIFTIVLCTAFYFAVTSYNGQW